MNVKMDDAFAAALRTALVNHVANTPVAQRRRTRRRLALGGAGVAVALLGGGVAAAGVFALPGADVVTPLAASVTRTGTGTGTVDLGAAPAGSTAIDIQLTCLSAGTFYTQDGASMVCDGVDAGKGTMRWQVPLHPGQQDTTIRAAAGDRWRIVATYSHVAGSKWGTNADGLTYGVANDQGVPDLLAVIATNGRQGYVYSRNLDAPEPTALQTGPSTAAPLRLPVYKSDGHTVIGEFLTDGAPADATAVATPGS